MKVVNRMNGRRAHVVEMEAERFGVGDFFFGVARRLGEIFLVVENRERVIVEHAAVAVDIVLVGARGEEQGYRHRDSHGVGDRHLRRMLGREGDGALGREVCAHDVEGFEAGRLKIGEGGAGVAGLVLDLLLDEMEKVVALEPAVMCDDAFDAGQPAVLEFREVHVEHHLFDFRRRVAEAEHGRRYRSG